MLRHLSYISDANQHHLFHQDTINVGIAIHLQEADSTLGFEEGTGNYSEKAENSNSFSPAYVLATGKIKKREGLFALFYWYTAPSSARRHVLILGLWSHEDRDEAKGRLSWLSNHWRNGFMHGKQESKLCIFPWTSLVKVKRYLILLYDYNISAQERFTHRQHCGKWSDTRAKKSHLPFGQYFIKQELFFLRDSSHWGSQIFSSYFCDPFQGTERTLLALDNLVFYYLV